MTSISLHEELETNIITTATLIILLLKEHYGVLGNTSQSEEKDLH